MISYFGSLSHGPEQAHGALPLAGGGQIAFPARPNMLKTGDLAGHGRTSYIEDIVGRVAQYVDEHYPVDKWHLGDLIAWVAQSALKYRPRICELSKRTTKDDRVSQEIAPHTVTPCEIVVCRSTINAGSDRWPVRLKTRVRCSSALRLNRDSSLKMTRLQSVTLNICPRSAKIQSTLPMMWGQW
ncbi:hypothetical protein TNCV_3206681 [Trichonephila clavipes]|nr:hypothetical protein TNCV_3206681 [Trichonephila clavipes]